MVPTLRLVALALIPFGLAFFTLAEPGLVTPMIGVDVVLALVAAADAFAGRRGMIDVKRVVPEVMSLGRPNVVEVELRSRARRRLRVRVTLDAFEHARLDEREHVVLLPSLGRGAVRVKLEPRRRGAYTLGATHLRYATPLGLFEKQVTHETTNDVRVYPDLVAVRIYELLARQDREHALVRASKRLGGESEFDQLREYSRDDEYRAIDWRATARRGRIIARQFRIETNQNVVFMLDAGRLATSEANGVAIFDHALNATLMLAHVAVRNDDRVGLLAFAEREIGFLAPQGGRNAVSKIVRTIYDVHPELVEPDYERAFLALQRRIRKRTLVTLFTQVVDDEQARTLVSMTRVVSRTHLVLIVLFRDMELEAMALHADGTPMDLYRRGAAAELVAWRAQVVRALESAGALVLDVDPTEVTPRLINRYLDIKARQLL